MTTAPATVRVAEPERRFRAFVVDRALAWTVFAVAVLAAWWWFFRNGAVLAGIGLVGGVVLVVSLAFALVLGLRGSSPGRALFGLRVVDARTGGPIGVPRALGRTLVLGMASLPMFGLGLATLAWTAVEDRAGERRGWHDHVVGSVVVDVRPLPAEEESSEDRPRQIVNLTTMRLMQVNPTEPPVVPAPEPAQSRPSAPPKTPAAHVPPAPEPAPPARPATAQAGGTPTAAASRRPGEAATWRVEFDSGESFVVEGVGVVGRQPQGRPGETVRHVVPLVSRDMSISKTHAQFHLAADGALVVTDRGSTNGSLLIRKGVARELTAGRPATLVDGDRVRFGDREMRVSKSGS